MRRKRQKTKSSISLRLLFFSRYLASYRILLKGMVHVQHYATLRRVNLGATAVNLVAGEKLADVYSEIVTWYVVKDAKVMQQQNHLVTTRIVGRMWHP